ncbi:MAG: hypothetical protein PWP31_1994 [Clostridia bacterium]|nr:hypothetical protein [Clostridia bacterium]
MTKKLTILVGPPGAGKSTWRQKFKGKIISTDDIRREIFGVQFYPKLEPAVWRIAFQRLRNSLKEDKEVCFDATNTTRARRRPLIKMGKEANASIEAVVFLIDLETLLERNAKRPPGKKVPKEVVKKKYEELEMPAYEEGIDLIKIIRPTT